MRNCRLSNTIMESHPRQCKTPDGKTFVETIITTTTIVKITDTTMPLLKEEGQIIVKQHDSAGLLIAECANKSYITEIADYIIEGTIERVESKWDEERTSIFTYSDLKIEKYVKGEAFLEDKKIQIVIPGGIVGEITQAVEDQPIFHEGKKVRIYFQKTNEGEFSIVCAQMGVEDLSLNTGEEQKIKIANPASVYCKEHEGELEIRKDIEGNEYGVCIFSDGSECEEWAFFRGECKKGEVGEKFCKDLCGDGICQEIVCMAIGRPCPETKENCQKDC